MLTALLTFLGCQFAGEVIRDLLDLPIPGPVLGMILLTLALALRPQAAASALDTPADGLIAHMGLMFVPAGVGIVAEARVLEAEWLPILAGVVGSTLIGVAVTGAVLHWTLPKDQEENSDAPSA